MTRPQLEFVHRPAHRSGKTAVITIASVVTVLLVLAGVWFWPRVPNHPTADQNRQVAEEFLTQIRQGEASRAWESTTAEFKSALGREKFLKQVKQHPFLTKPMEFVDIQPVAVQQAGRTEAVFKAIQGRASVRVLAGNEGGKFRVDRMTLIDP